MRAKDLGFLLAFALALLPAAALELARAGISLNLAAWFPLFFIFVVLPVIDALCGSDATNADAGQTVRLDGSVYFRALSVLALPVWLALLVYCTWQASHLPFDALGLLGWTMSAGILGGVLAITPAHELVHKSGAFERFCGGVLLSSVGYHGFKIEHVRGHHVHVATPLDSSSARLGESVYRFVPRALRDNVRNAWRLEARRLRQGGRSAWSPGNEMLCWTALWATMLIAFACWLGPFAALFAFFAGVGAAVSLEIINYIEHYGLSREQLAADRYERVTHLHSWNASQRVSNWLLLNLQRHSDHHEHARRRYQVLLHHDDSPQLPAGYATMFVLALVPPLWRHVMDPRARGAAGARGLPQAS